MAWADAANTRFHPRQRPLTNRGERAPSPKLKWGGSDFQESPRVWNSHGFRWAVFLAMPAGRGELASTRARGCLIGPDRAVRACARLPRYCPELMDAFVYASTSAQTSIHWDCIDARAMENDA